MSKSKPKPLPPDQDQRELIVNKLDENMLVEAAAGTGKTTSMIARMIALVEQGCCEIETLAAVTFTRKAAAELRSRFQVELDQAARKAAGPAKERLSKAAERVERCFIGTIHSFCARLLRERPIEAGIDVDFEELDEVADSRLKQQAWDQFVAQLFASEDPQLQELDDVGLEISQLWRTFETFTEYTDVDNWPCPQVRLPSTRYAAAALTRYVDDMRKLLPALPSNAGRDKLMPKYRRISRLARQTDLTRPAELMTVLEEFGAASVVQRNWPGGRAQALAELARWDKFIAEHVEPLLAAWREYRYEKVLRTVRRAAEWFNRLRQASSRLNFQDLLMRAAALLRDKPHIRRYFRRRFTHLLVDEFQDTDPIQAEVMLLLTADDPAEPDWRKCRPVGGSLFVVGDPKQSIYRFRRADIVTYSQVKQAIQENGGRIVTLSANFRSAKPIVEWVNGVFDRIFPSEATPQSPANVPLQVARTTGSNGQLAGLGVLVVPAAYGKNETAAAYDANFVARTIRKMLAEEVAIPRTEKELAAGMPLHVEPGDFLIITLRKGRLSLYAQELQRLGVPHQVTGGSALNQVAELVLLHRCLLAVTRPADPVALLAALRSELFGVSDAALYEFSRQGGQFTFRSPMPEGFEGKDAEAVDDALTRLARYAHWLARLSPVAAIEKIVADLGLSVLACSAEGGDVQAGSVAKAIELLRSAAADKWTAADLVDYLGGLTEQAETYDGIPARPREGSVVRVMNLHKAKGLDAPVVFLADPGGEWEFPPTLYVDRSGDQVLGYMAAYGEARGFGRPPLLACPPGWDDLAEKEGAFAAAEKLRLLYVAATRAGTSLIISQREKGNSSNPWGPFAEALTEAPALGDPGEQRAPDLAQRTLRPGQIEAAMEAISQRWQVLAKPSYAMAAAKAIALGAAGVSGGTVGPSIETTETEQKGAEWGSAIHVLLAAAMENPQADLRALARSVIAQQELPAQFLDEAIHTVQTVTKSKIWNRAIKSRRRLCEVPLQLAIPVDPGRPDAVPTIVRAVIDLAFQEDGGWVIVDYKTDVAAKSKLDALVGKYGPQVRAYAEAWHEVTGQTVLETGLYFTKVNTYVACAL